LNEHSLMANLFIILRLSTTWLISISYLYQLSDWRQCNW
jgi:hypothetical protein